MQSLNELKRRSMSHISINTGYRCNQSCRHCHLQAGPERQEVLDNNTAALLIDFIEKIKPDSAEITGGAPELMPGLDMFISNMRPLVKKISLRTNLTLLNTPGYGELLEMLYCNHIGIVASLPCFTEENVDTQRGKDVFRKSIGSLKVLNRLGYGREENKRLDLVYNPLSAQLPPGEKKLEKVYRKELDRYGIVFDNLYTLANVPLGRFKKELESSDRYNEYIKLLKDNFNSNTLDNLMCLDQVTVDWKGNIYDCDFNLANGLPAGGFSHISDPNIKDHIGSRIHIGEYCLACTAGSGSSCHGALDE